MTDNRKETEAQFKREVKKVIDELCFKLDDEDDKVSVVYSLLELAYCISANSEFDGRKVSSWFIDAANEVDDMYYSGNLIVE